MKKILSYFFVLLVTALYVVSTMGYGMHECKHDGTQDVIVLFGETPCEYIHSHIDGTGSIYTHAHIACDCGMDHSGYEHDDSCCQTTVYIVTSDQTVEDNIASLQASVKICFTALVPLSMTLVEFLPDVITRSDAVWKVPSIGDAMYLRNGVLRV